VWTKIFSVSKDLAKVNLKGFFFHNWTKDAFAKGAYTHVRVNGQNKVLPIV